MLGERLKLSRERFFCARLTAASYVFPHVWHPGSAGKYARYPPSWRTISSVYVHTFLSIGYQYTILSDESVFAAVGARVRHFR